MRLTLLACVGTFACTLGDRIDITDLNTLTIGYGGDEYLLGLAAGNADIYHEKIPGIYLYSRLRATVARPWIRGLDATPGWLSAVNRLWIEAEK